jgi:predicted Zn-dependent peptidase
LYCFAGIRPFTKGDLMWDPYAEFETAVLPNGLTVHAAHWPGRPWVKMGFVVHSGARHDPVGKEGTAHFVEHMVTDNAPLPTRELTTFFTNLGGSVNLGSTSYFATTYKFTIPSARSHVEKAFDIFGNMLLGSALDSYLERERAVINDEIRRKYPISLERETRWRRKRSLYSNHWFARSLTPAGSVETVKNISQEDLQSFYDTNYTPSNMQIVCVGSMNVGELARMLEASPFGMVKPGVRQPLPEPLEWVNKPSENRCVIEFSKHFGTQSALHTAGYASVAVLPGTLSYWAVILATAMLGEELHEEIREKRAWTYGMRVSRYSFQELYEVEIDCSSLTLSAIDEIENAVDQCIESLRFRDDLFDKTKRERCAGFDMADLTANDVRGGAMSDLCEYQRITSYAEDYSGLMSVTMDSVRNVLEYLRPERRWTILRVP